MPSRPCWSSPAPTSPSTTSPAPEQPSGRPATSCACDPASAPCPPRSRSCGRGSTTPLRPLLTYIYPTYAVPALLELAHAYVALDDVAGARAALRQAGDVLRLRPDLGTLPAQVQELRSRLDRVPAAVPGSSSLTTAELRLLPLLATHLSFTEIGQRLFLSKHTIKTQAISIYRKLGASSRSEAVQRVREVGLLGS